MGVGGDRRPDLGQRDCCHRETRKDFLQTRNVHKGKEKIGNKNEGRKKVDDEGKGNASTEGSSRVREISGPGVKQNGHSSP